MLITRLSHNVDYMVIMLNTWLNCINGVDNFGLIYFAVFEKTSNFVPATERGEQIKTTGNCKTMLNFD